MHYVQEENVASGKVHSGSRKNHNVLHYNIPTKKVGYLALECTDFQFVGPDRHPVVIDSIEKCIVAAKIIQYIKFGFPLSLVSCDR